MTAGFWDCTIAQKQPPNAEYCPSFPAAAHGFPGEEINLSSSFQQTKKSAIDSVSNAEDTKGLQRRDADIVTTGWQEPVTPAAAAVEHPDSAAETQLQ